MARKIVVIILLAMFSVFPSNSFSAAREPSFRIGNVIKFSVIGTPGRFELLISGKYEGDKPDKTDYFVTSGYIENHPIVKICHSNDTRWRVVFETEEGVILSLKEKEIRIEN